MVMEYVYSFFEKQVQENPENLALICDDIRLSYQQMDVMCAQIARFLRAKTLGRGSRIALLLPKTAELYISMLAIMKIGAAYIPIDPEYPAERIEYIVQDAQANLVLTLSELTEKSAHLNCEKVFIDKIREEQLNLVTELEITRHDDDLCYIAYTSGSTGQPKGVEITQRNVCHYIRAALQIYAVNASDRIYQGFSIAFDASVEEIWLAFATGAALVTSSSAALHNGAHLAQFFNLHEVTVFSTVPTMLSMLEGEIPTLRLLILGGENCFPELIARWSRPGLRIVNTYGPTETTVIASFKECVANELISIGKPIPNCEIHILDENHCPVAVGDIGEIYIGGAGVAKGYTKAELTQERFIFVERLQQRLYRSGDLGQWTDQQEIKFMGRSDNQVKLRGYRVELSEIENVLLLYSSIRAAAVTLHKLVEDVQLVVAYLVPRAGKTIDENALKTFLHTHLPDYMIPNVFETLTQLPLLSNGKVDRKRLPKPKMHYETTQKNHVAPTSTTEKLLATVWEKLFNIAPISVQSDFFQDLGGHSLLAAKMISQLRKQPDLPYISMLDLFENPTIKGLSSKIDVIRRTQAKSADKTEDPVFSKKSKWRYRLTGLGQFLGLYIPFSASSWTFLLFFLLLKAIYITEGFLSFQFFEAFIGFLLIINPMLFAMAIISKWILLGRIKSGKHPLWGWYYFRWWLANAFQGLAPVEYLVGSPLMNVYCRLMGSKIGKNCFIGNDNIRAFDLFKMGDDSSIGLETSISGYKVENGWLKIGGITIGNDCYVGANCVLSINSEIKDAGKLADHSMLSENFIIKENQTYCGSPARLGNVTLNQERNESAYKKSSKVKYSIYHCIALYYMLFLYAIALLPGIALIDYFLFEKHSYWIGSLLIVPIAALIEIILLCGLITLSKKIILGTVKPGHYCLDSNYYVRKWLVDNLIKLSQSVMGSLYATLYFPMWFRTLGAKIGIRTEISSVTHISPDLLTIEDESFLADGVILGVPQIYKNYISIALNKIGKRAFVGNSALIPQGVTVGEGCLIGCLSIAPTNGDTAEPRSSWLGSPAVVLPKREILAGFVEQETYAPKFNMYLKRAIFDFIRVISPGYFAYLTICLQLIIVSYLLQYHSLMAVFLLFPLITAGITVTIMMTIILLKWILIGKYRESIKPAWSTFVWCNELITGLYDFCMVPFLLGALAGTPFMAFFLRLLGAKIGKACFIDTTFFTEFDLIEIGNHAALNENCTIQTHLFEDRVMKMAKLKIMDHCNVGSMSIVLYDTLMERGSSLENLSLLMKGETLPAYSRWLGVPAQAINSGH